MSDDKKPKIQIKRFKDLDTWSIRPSKEGIINGTQVDLELASKIQEILNSYGYDVEVIGTGNFIEQQDALFGHESKLIEYRAEVKEKYNYDDWKSDYLIDLSNDRDISVEDLEKELTEAEIEKMNAEYEEVPYTDIAYGNIAYSFFVGKNIKSDMLQAAALYYGYLYMNLLMKVDESIIMRGNLIEDTLYESPDGFKEYLSHQGININNKNVERVTKVNYRIYKDSKFFGEAQGEIKAYKRIIEEILAL